MRNISVNSEDVNTSNHIPKKLNKGTNKLSVPFKNLFSKFNNQDLLLFGLLFLLIEEGVEDEFLIFVIVFLILTDPD